MNVDLPLTPEMELALERRAHEAGVNVADFIIKVLKQRLDKPTANPQRLRSYAKWKVEFHKWIAEQRSQNPKFDDSRDSIYD
jgi:hypothetical protein